MSYGGRENETASTCPATPFASGAPRPKSIGKDKPYQSVTKDMDTDREAQLKASYLPILRQKLFLKHFMSADSFRDRMTNPHSHPILYEILPPPPGNGVEAFFTAIEKIVSAVPIDAFNVPEIREEKGQTSHKAATTTPKSDPRPFAQRLAQRFPDSATIVNHGVVYEPFENFTTWVAETAEQFRITHMVFVGGESSSVRYPGPTVNQAAGWIRSTYNRGKESARQVTAGGITIPTRRHLNPDRDEPARMLAKAEAGIEFFTSQVVYEAESMKKLLSDYDELCRQKGHTPRRVCVSFAPVSTTKDIQFLRWLGVWIPESVERELHEGWIGMGWRSVEMCKNILQDILEHIDTHRLRVPIGINVEHIMKYNVELSKELLVTLSQQLSH